MGLKPRTHAKLAVVLYVLSGCLAASAFAQVDAAPAFLDGPFLQSATTTSVWICWNANKPCSAKLVVTQADQVSFRKSVDAAEKRQEILIEGLQPQTGYDYQVQLDGGESQRGRFFTAPTPGQPMLVALWGDSRSNPEVCRQVAELIRKSGATLTIHTGDLVRQGGSDPQTWTTEFFNPARDLLRNIVFYAVMGNHEYSGKPAPEVQNIFVSQFHQPGNERYYSFDYGDIHFCILDSDRENDTPAKEDGFEPWSVNSPQYLWAKDDLLSSKAKWKIVAFHKPIYCSGQKRSARQMRLTYAPLFAQANVDLIVTGDEHNFQFSKPIRHFAEPEQKHPYWHLITAGGGAPTYPVSRVEPFADLAGQFHHFTLLKISGDRLEGRVIQLDGTEFAHFIIDKDAQPENQVSYELIDFVQMLREWLAMSISYGDSGAAGLILDKVGQTAPITMTFENTMPFPAHISVRFEKHPEIQITPTEQTIELKPKAKITLKLEAKALASQLSQNTPKPVITVDSEVGRAVIQYDFPGPPGSRNMNLNIAMPSNYTVASVAPNSIAIDGKMDDNGWKGLPVSDTFWAAGEGCVIKPSDTTHPIFSKITTLRIAHDPQALYLAIERIDNERAAGPDDTLPLVLWLGPPNVEPTRIVVNYAPPKHGLIQWVQKPGGAALITEIKVPFQALNTPPPKPGEIWALNVCRQETKVQCVWSPTTQPIASDTPAQVVEKAGRLVFQ